jgi:hypothetical protein
MSISRLLSVLVAVVLVVTTVLAIRANVAAGADLSDCFQRQPGSAIPANSAASDWVERHAAFLKAGNAAPDWVERHTASLVAGDAAADWVERHATALQAGNALSGC